MGTVHSQVPLVVNFTIVNTPEVVVVGVQAACGSTSTGSGLGARFVVGDSVGEADGLAERVWVGLGEAESLRAGGPLGTVSEGLGEDEGLADGVPEEAATAIATIPAPQDFAGSESQALPPRKGPDAAVIRSRIACAGTDSDRYVAAAAATWAAAIDVPWPAA